MNRSIIARITVMVFIILCLFSFEFCFASECDLQRQVNDFCSGQSPTGLFNVECLVNPDLQKKRIMASKKGSSYQQR